MNVRLESNDGSRSNIDPDWLWYEKFQAGEKSAFNELFQKYKNILINLAFRYVKVRESAEDIAQDVLIKVYEKKAKFDPRSKFSTWLYRVTVNASLDLLRKKKYLFQSLDEEIEKQQGEQKTILEKLGDSKSVSPGSEAATQELNQLVQKEIDRLSEKFRSVILLYQFEEMSYQEIAKILGITTKAVERRLYHAKEILKKRLFPLLG